MTGVSLLKTLRLELTGAVEELVGTAGSIEAWLERAGCVGQDPCITYKLALERPRMRKLSVEKPCRKLTLACWPQDPKRFAFADSPHPPNTRQNSSKIGAWGKHWPLLMLSCSRCRAGSLGRAGVPQVCACQLPTRSLRQTNPPVAPAYPAKSLLQPAAWVISRVG
jgi:hypothetical protein